MMLGSDPGIRLQDIFSTRGGAVLPPAAGMAGAPTAQPLAMQPQVDAGHWGGGGGGGRTAPPPVPTLPPTGPGRGAGGYGAHHATGLGNHNPYSWTTGEIMDPNGLYQNFNWAGSRYGKSMGPAPTNWGGSIQPRPVVGGPPEPPNQQGPPKPIISGPPEPPNTQGPALPAPSGLTRSRRYY